MTRWTVIGWAEGCSRLTSRLLSAVKDGVRRCCTWGFSAQASNDCCTLLVVLCMLTCWVGINAGSIAYAFIQYQVALRAAASPSELSNDTTTANLTTQAPLRSTTRTPGDLLAGAVIVTVAFVSISCGLLCVLCVACCRPKKHTDTKEAAAVEAGTNRAPRDVITTSSDHSIAANTTLDASNDVTVIISHATTDGVVTSDGLQSDCHGSPALPETPSVPPPDPDWTQPPPSYLSAVEMW